MLGHRPMVPEDYLAILKRRWWIVLLPVLILPFLAYAFSYTIPPQYLSQTLVIIEAPKVADNYVKPVISSDLDSRLASMKEQILSRSHVQPIIERYNLYGNGHIDMDDRIEMVRKDIDIKPIHSEVARAGGLPGFSISFKADDAHTAQLVCSEITTLFLNENLKSREASAEGTTDFLKGQLNDAKRNLDEQDAKLASFQRQYSGRLPDQAGANSQMLTSLNTQLEATTQQLNRAEQDRSYLQTMITQQSTAPVISSPGIPAMPSSAVSPLQQELQVQLQSLEAQQQQLTTQYTDDYPDVIAVKRKIADVKKQLAHSASPTSSGSSASGVPYASRESIGMQQLRAQLRAADVGIDEKRKEQSRLQAQIGSYQGKIESTPMVEEQYKQLTRDYQTTLASYDELLGKMNQSKMATDLEKRQQGEQFTMVDAANLPDAPFSPKRGLFLGSGAAFGLFLGIAISGLLEYRDTTLRSERDVWAFTKLPTLGLIGYSDAVRRDAATRGKGTGLKRLLPFRKPKQMAGAQG